MMSSMRARIAALFLTTVSFGLLYWPVLQNLWRDWSNDDNYSHGFLIVPLAAYFVWERWDRIRALTPKPSFLGLVVLVGGLCVLLAGLLGAELFLTRASMLIVLAGAVLFLLGWPAIRAVAFPLA